MPPKRTAPPHVLDPVMEMGMEPDQVGALALRGLRENAEYVFTHAEYAGMIESRVARVLRAAAQSGGA